MADKSKLPSDNFISRIVKDPRQVPDTLLLSGYLGSSSEEKHTRLYFDAQLTSYVEIPDEGMLHTQDYPDDHLGRSYVWIKKDAVLIHGKAGTKAKFLEGPIVNEYMNVAAVGQGAGTTSNSIFYCNETYQDWVCGTTKRGLLCTIVQQPTQEQWCPTNYRPYCPPVTRTCPTHSDGPAICPTTKICEVKLTDFEQQQAQPMGFTLQQCPVTVYPGCPPPYTQNSPVCSYTLSGAICPTHTPACFPSVYKICVTHTPVCYPSVNQVCVTQTTFCNIRSVNAPCITLTRACNEADTVIGCPIQSAICPSLGACPSIACGFGGGLAGGGNPAY